MQPVPLHSGETQDTYFFEGRVVTHGAGRSTFFTDKTSSASSCMLKIIEFYAISDAIPTYAGQISGSFPG